MDKILGVWVTDPTDDGGMAALGHATLNFYDNGLLDYTLHRPDRDQVMLLTFRIEGCYLIMNQPSAPHEERTAFTITDDGKLTLSFGGVLSRYIREFPTTP